VEVEINIKNAVVDKAILHSKRFLSDVGDELQNVTAENIKRAVLLGNGTISYAEAKDLNNRPQLCKLINTLKVKVVCWR